MATADLSTDPTNIDASTPAATAPSRLAKLAMLLFAIAIGVGAFLAFDWFHTAAGQRHVANLGDTSDSCRERDPVRHHVFKPNCATVNYWGTDEYKVFTNSLGFRDENIREVPLTDPRPRILMLGNSYTEGKTAWNKTFAGRMATELPQYDFLNGGVDGYSPSNYVNTARMVLDKGVEIDEVIVFIDNSVVQLEAAFYRDANGNGAVTAIPPAEQHSAATAYGSFRKWIGHHLVLTYRLLRLGEHAEGTLVSHGFYHVPGDYFGDPFDMEMSAWSYREVNQSEPFAAGYAPLGVAGGTARSLAKMTQLWQELAGRNIPISVVVYPHLAQVVHDTAESREIQLWRQWCEGKCKRFVSVAPKFYAARDACSKSQPGCWYSKLFIVGDMHYNAGGNALVAAAVSESLAADPPVKVKVAEQSLRPASNSEIKTGSMAAVVGLGH
jgi:hypothetical protein